MMIRIFHVFLLGIVVTSVLDGLHWLATGKVMPALQVTLLSGAVHLACGGAIEARRIRERRRLHELYNSPSYGE